MSKMPLGTRVETTADIDCCCDDDCELKTLSKGERGTVVARDDHDCTWIRWDKHYPQLSEYQNCSWIDETTDPVRVIGEVPIVKMLVGTRVETTADLDYGGFGVIRAGERGTVIWSRPDEGIYGIKWDNLQKGFLTHEDQNCSDIGAPYCLFGHRIHIIDHEYRVAAADDGTYAIVLPGVQQRSIGYSRTLRDAERLARALNEAEQRRAGA